MVPAGFPPVMTRACSKPPCNPPMTLMTTMKNENVGFRFHRCRRVHIAHHGNARIAVAQEADIFRGNRGCKRAPCLEIRNQNRFLRAEKLCGLGHEVDAAQDNDLGVSPGCLTGEGQRVASEISDPVEDLRRLVVVSQDDGVALTFELVNCCYVWSVNGPFDLRDDPPDALKYGRGCPSDLWRIVESRWRQNASEI